MQSTYFSNDTYAKQANFINYMLLYTPKLSNNYPKIDKDRCSYSQCVYVTECFI